MKVNKTEFLFFINYLYFFTSKSAKAEKQLWKINYDDLNDIHFYFYLGNNPGTQFLKLSMK